MSMHPFGEAELKNAIAARFYAVNGTHPMTADDDAYVRKWYISVEELARRAGVQPSELRRLILANRLPLPSYILTDGTQMVARDLLELPRRAGGYDELPEWFAQHFESTRDAIREWDGYLKRALRLSPTCFTGDNPTERRVGKSNQGCHGRASA